MVRYLEQRVFIEDELNGIQLCKNIEKAGRICYKSEGKITQQSYITFLKKIISSGHHSVLEHEKITVRFILPRGLSHELVRHRLTAISQESSRYCSYNKDKFGNEISLVQMSSGLNSKQLKRRQKLHEQIEKVYMAELAEGIKPQQARDNLPICLKTEMFMTANIREWRHILQLRTSKAAHPEIRRLMIELLNQLKVRVPILFEDIKIEELK